MAIKKRKQCQQMPVSGITNVKIVVLYLSQKKVTVAYFVRTALYHAHLFNKEKTRVVEALNVRF